MTGPDLLQRCISASQSGQREAALALARERRTKDLHDPALHLAWADLLEELGLVDDAVQELNLALREAPENHAVCLRLADIYLDQGKPHKAAHVLGELARGAPAEPRFAEAWGQALEEAGEYAKARQVYQEALEGTGDPRFTGLLHNLGFLEDEPPTAPPAPTDQLLPQPHHLVAFTSLFAGREGVYARQWVSPTGESGYTPVEEPLTLKVAENHLLGNYTIGVYPVRLDNTVTFIAFDFDLAKFAVQKTITSQRAWQGVMAKVHQLACKLVDLGAAHELPVYLEDSGFKGRHAWVFLDTPLPAGVAKKCGDLLVSQLLPLPVEVTVEVFPKQTSVKRGGLGNLIKLPLGFHKRTGRRAVFLQPDGEAIPDQLGLLNTFTKASRRAVYSLIQRLQGSPGSASVPQAAPETTEPPWEEGTKLPPSTPEAPPYHLENDVQVQCLLNRCATLQALVIQVTQTARLSKDETLVLIHTLGHLEHGPEAVNTLFERCLNADPTLFLKSPLRGHPMSCPKIRSRIPHLTATVNCNCAFALGVNLYPTPLIHLQALETAKTSAPASHVVDSWQFQNLLQDYLKLRRQLHETQVQLGRCEEALSQFFQEAGVESVQTPLGTLHCRPQEDGKVIFSLEM